MMLTIELDKTVCNLKCKICYNYDGCIQQPYQGLETRNTFLKIEFIRQAKERFPNLGVTISGGEPFISEQEVFILLDYLHKNNIPTWIVTNGTVLNEKMIQYLSRFKNLQTTISFHSHKEEDYNFYTSSTHLFPKLLENIDLFLKYDMDIMFNVLLMRMNKDYIIKLIQFIKENYHKPVALLFVSFVFNQTDFLKSQVLTAVELKKYVEKIKAVYPEITHDLNMENVYNYYSGKLKNKSCAYMHNNFILRNWGQLDFCNNGSTLPFNFFELPNFESYLEYIYPKNKELQLEYFCKVDQCQEVGFNCRAE